MNEVSISNLDFTSPIDWRLLENYQ
jgi:hypothetical protein